MFSRVGNIKTWPFSPYFLISSIAFILSLNVKNSSSILFISFLMTSFSPVNLRFSFLD
jgi:hypothetical protein